MQLITPDGRKIQRALHRKGWGRSQLKNAAKIDYKTIKKALNGEPIRSAVLKAIATALGTNVESLLPDECPPPPPPSPVVFDVVIPIGPVAVDFTKTRRVDGLKPLTALTIDGKSQALLHILFDSLAPMKSAIGNIYMLVMPDESFQARCGKLQQCVNKFHDTDFGQRVKLVPENGSSWTGGKVTLVEVLCDLREKLSDQFILHYNDVWPAQPEFYQQFLGAAEFSATSHRTRRVPYGGILACATQQPKNFQLSDSLTNDDVANQLYRMVASVAKPFHVVKVHAVTATQHTNNNLHLANMAISILHKGILDSLVKSRNTTPLVGEFYQMLSDHLLGNFVFDVFPYTGDWFHCDDKDDAEFFSDPTLSD